MEWHRHGHQRVMPPSAPRGGPLTRPDRLYGAAIFGSARPAPRDDKGYDVDDDRMGDYIEVTGVEHDADLVEQLMRLLPPPAVRRKGHTTFPVIDLGGGVEMLVDECGEDLAVLAVGGEQAQTAVRRAGARRVFHTLAEATGWSLRWSADDADGLIASRLAAAPIVLHPGRLILVSSGQAAAS